MFYEYTGLWRVVQCFHDCKNWITCSCSLTYSWFIQDADEYQNYWQCLYTVHCSPQDAEAYFTKLVWVPDKIILLLFFRIPVTNSPLIWNRRNNINLFYVWIFQTLFLWSFLVYFVSNKCHCICPWYLTWMDITVCVRLHKLNQSVWTCYQSWLCVSRYLAQKLQLYDSYSSWSCCQEEMWQASFLCFLLYLISHCSHKVRIVVPIFPALLCITWQSLIFICYNILSKMA